MLKTDRPFGCSQQSPIQSQLDRLDSIRQSTFASSFPQIGHILQCQREATKTAMAAFFAAWLCGGSLATKNRS